MIEKPSHEIGENPNGTPVPIYGRIYGAASLSAILKELFEAGSLSAKEVDPDSNHLDAEFISRALEGLLPDVDALSLLLGRWGYSLAIVPNAGGLAIDFASPWAEFETD